MEEENETTIITTTEYERVIIGIAKYKKITDWDISTGVKIYLPWGDYYITRVKLKLGVKVIKDETIKNNNGI